MSEEKQIVKYQANAPVQSRGTLKDLMASPGIQAMFRDGIATHLTPERLTKMVLMAVTKTPKLLECTQESLFTAAMQAGQLGLDCSGTLGSAYLVPFGTTATLIPGYGGLIDLAFRSGEVSVIMAMPVYKAEHFIYEIGFDPKFEHKPDFTAFHKASLEDKPDVALFYAMAKMKNGSHHLAVMSVHDIERIRGMSKMGKYGAWKDHWIEMGKKTVIRRLMKTLPLSVERLDQIQQAIELDNKQYNFDPSKEISLSATDGKRVSLKPPEDAEDEHGEPESHPVNADPDNVKTLMGSGKSHKWTPEKIKTEIGIRYERDPEDMTATQCAEMTLHVGKTDWKDNTLKLDDK